MRTAIVVLPLCTGAAAAALLGVQLHHRPAPPPAMIVAPMPLVVTPRPPLPRAAGRYDHPVGGQYLEADLLIARQDAPPALLEPHTGDDAFRYAWRYEALATAMATELAAVIDDACPGGCARSAAARTALQSWLDADGPGETHTLRRWTIDDSGVHTYMRRLAVHAGGPEVAIDVTCTSRSYTIGMRMWNDDTACDATLRDRGRVLATYHPRQLAVLEHGSALMPIDAYEQTVHFAGGAELVTSTGWDYEGPPDMAALAKTRARSGPAWGTSTP